MDLPAVNYYYKRRGGYVDSRSPVISMSGRKGNSHELLLLLLLLLVNIERL